MKPNETLGKALRPLVALRNILSLNESQGDNMSPTESPSRPGFANTWRKPKSL